MSEPTDRLEGLLERAGRFFMGKSPLHAATEEIARRLNELGVDYAVAGAIALATHGYERLTTDVDVLITREGLAKFKEAHLGRGYLEGSKGVRDTANGIKIDFLLTGDFPGDGKPKTVSFPDPREVAADLGRFRVLRVEVLVQLKLASGISGGVNRLKDLADVIELIKAAKLPRELGDELDPYVRAKYFELWDAIAAAPADEY